MRGLAPNRPRSAALEVGPRVAEFSSKALSTLKRALSVHHPTVGARERNRHVAVLSVPRWCRQGRGRSGTTRLQQIPGLSRLVLGLVRLLLALRHVLPPLFFDGLLSATTAGLPYAAPTQGSQHGCTVKVHVEPRQETDQEDSISVRLT